MEEDELIIAFEAEVRSLTKLINLMKRKKQFLKTLQKLPIKLRCKLRNSMWRNK